LDFFLEFLFFPPFLVVTLTGLALTGLALTGLALTGLALTGVTLIGVDFNRPLILGIGSIEPVSNFDILPGMT
jgi:hypothetical protein